MTDTETNEPQGGTVTASDPVTPGIDGAGPGEAAGAPGAGSPVALAEPAPAPKAKAKRTARRSRKAAAAPVDVVAQEDQAPAEDPRLSSLSAQLAEQAEQLTANATATDALKAQLRDAAIARLGVLPHYRADVPAYDVTTPEGRAKLEDWAKARPEIRATVPVAGMPTVSADEVLAKVTSPHLVDAEWFRRALAEA